MNTEPPKTLKLEVDVISFVDILLFLKASVHKILLSTVVCLFAGACYYFAAPNSYEASVTIQMGRVSGEMVETPVTLFEKIKLLSYFPDATIKTCHEDPRSRGNFANKVKATVNQQLNYISLIIYAPTKQEAKECLSAIYTNIEEAQNKIAKPLIDAKKKKIDSRTYVLRLIKDFNKNHPTDSVLKKEVKFAYHESYLINLSRLANDIELSKIREEIENLEIQLAPPLTSVTSQTSPIHVSESPANKRPQVIFGVSLALGVILGLLMTLLVRFAPLALGFKLTNNNPPI
jgi:hypothetical protein